MQPRSWVEVIRSSFRDRDEFLLFFLNKLETKAVSVKCVGDPRFFILFNFRYLFVNNKFSVILLFSESRFGYVMDINRPLSCRSCLCTFCHFPHSVSCPSFVFALILFTAQFCFVIVEYFSMWGFVYNFIMLKSSMHLYACLRGMNFAIPEKIF